VGNSIEISGMDELLKKLEYMVSPSKQNTTISKALKSGAKIIQESVKPKIPRSSLSKEHAADHIEISGIKKKDGVSYVTVGADPSDNNEFFYLKFYEFGTSKPNALGLTFPALAMFGRTIAEEKENVKEQMEIVIKEELGL